MKHLIVLIGFSFLLILPKQTLALERVDTALILATDVSGSVTPDRYEVQKTGIEDALVDPEIIKAITYSDYGCIALLYMEWSSEDEQRVIVPWMKICSKEDAELFVKQMEASERAFHSMTGIGPAITFAIAQFDLLPWEPLRRIIDVSGDGINNSGVMPDPSGVPDGIIINGLPILELEAGLDTYYEKLVQAGVGSFVEPVNSYADVKFAFKRKLTREVAWIR